MLRFLQFSRCKPKFSIQTRSYASGKPQYTRFQKRRQAPVSARTATQIAIAVGALGGGYFVSHLEAAPETGRRRFMAVSHEREETLAAEMIQQIQQEYAGRILPLNHPITRHVRSVARRIITASNLGHLDGEAPSSEYSEPQWFGSDSFGVPQTPGLSANKEWVVLVVDDKKFINAFAGPGLVCVSTGILPIAEDEEGLAAIVGHEIGHVVMRHVSERLSQFVFFIPLLLAAAALGLDLQVSMFLGNILYDLPHSRYLETEADLVGLTLMSKACYDPGASPRVFERLNKFEASMGAANIPKFLSTHPPTDDRIQTLKDNLPKNYEIFSGNPECAALAEMRMQGVLNGSTKRVRVEDMRLMN